MPNERLRCLVVYRPQRAGVQQQLVQRAQLHPVGVGVDWRSLAHDDALRSARIRREEAPVHVPAVPQVWVVDVLSGPLEHLLYELLALVWPLDEELDRSSDKS